MKREIYMKNDFKEKVEGLLNKIINVHNFDENHRQLLESSFRRIENGVDKEELIDWLVKFNNIVIKMAQLDLSENFDTIPENEFLSLLSKSINIIIEEQAARLNPES